MARRLEQLSEVQEAFEARIKQKIAQEQSEVMSRVSSVLPLFGGMFTPLANWFFQLNQQVNQSKGNDGEAYILHEVIHYLPNTWVVFHNSIIEPEPEIFAQIDVLLIGPPGLFLIETKAWSGSFTAYRDIWRRRVGHHWEPCDSPNHQAQRQARLMRRWLSRFSNLALPLQQPGWIEPLVVFTHADWLGINNCSVRVFHGTHKLIPYLLDRQESLLTETQIKALAQVVMWTPTPQSQSNKPPTSTPTATTTLTAPLCPRCAIPMVLRISRQGRYQGKQFYGCKNFPHCREIINLPPPPQARPEDTA